MKHYYAEYCPYGISVGGDAKHDFKVFESRQERDKWVKDNMTDYDNNVVWGPATRAEVAHYFGGKFIIVDGYCYRDMYDYQSYQY